MQGKVQSVERALKILEVLSKSQEGLSLTDISRKIDLHKSTVYRLLNTLIQEGYVEQNKTTHHYDTTLKLFEMGYGKIQKVDVLSVAKPYLKELMELSNEAIHLVLREGTEVIYIEKVESKNTIRMYSSIGKRSPVYCTSVGKSMMAHMEDEELKNLWEASDVKPLTEYTITDYDVLKEELKDVKVKGYAVDEQENELGIRCVGAPIFNHEGDVVAAVSISGPTLRVTKKRIKDLGEAVKQYAMRISRELGYPN